MRRVSGFFALAVLFFSGAAALPGQEVLRGQVFVDREPVYALSPDVPYPLDGETVRRRALREAALLFSSIIYGWNFSYTAGERARGIAEDLELERLGEIPPGDARLTVTDARLDGQRFSMWTDYRMGSSQQRRLEQWRAGQNRAIQGTGKADLAFPGEAEGWLTEKQTALEDAAREALRAMLRGRERNRPKSARGRIALAEFPRWYFERGQWNVAAKFRVELVDVEAFSAY